MDFTANYRKFHWTSHIENKMRHYGLSKQRIRRVLKSPDRRELGIAPDTIAIMQTVGTKKRPTEIWLMYQDKQSKKERLVNMISAWRYPGTSPRGRFPEIPEDALLELEKLKQDIDENKTS